MFVSSIPAPAGRGWISREIQDGVTWTKKFLTAPTREKHGTIMHLGSGYLTYHHSMKYRNIWASFSPMTGREAYL